MNSTERITVYTPESGLRAPGKFFKALWVDVRGSRELAWRLTVRDIKARYRQSILGVFWSFMPPLVVAATWIFLRGQNVINVEDPGMPYPAFVLIGTLLWQTFANAMNAPLRLMSQSRSLLTKINFPREALLLSAFAQVIYDFLFKAVLLFIVYFAFDLSPNETLALAPLGVLVLILLGFTIGLLLLPLSMLYTDVASLLTVVLPFWFLLTPVIYPTPTSGLALLAARINPASPLLNTTRAWLTATEPIFLTEFWFITVATLLLAGVGIVLFRLALPHVIARIGS